MDIKLPKLPDRTPIRMTITILPDLKRALDDYAVVYQQTYGEDEPLAQLIPQMLATFLASDRAFARARSAVGKKGAGDHD